MSELAPIATPELVVVANAPAAGAHPVAVYLAGLSVGSRPVMLSALRSPAGLLCGGQLGDDLDVEAFPWAELRYPHLVALRALLQERYAPATANRLLCAVRGVLREAWRLGQLTTDDYQRACDVGGVRGSRLPVDRDVAMAEGQRLLELDGPSVHHVQLGDHLARRGDECVYDHDAIGDWLCSVEVQKVRDFPAPEAWVLAGGGTTPPESYDVLSYLDLCKRFRRGRVPWRESEWLGGWRPDGFDKASLPRKSEWVTFDEVLETS